MSCALYARLRNHSTDTTPTLGLDLLPLGGHIMTKALVSVTSNVEDLMEGELMTSHRRAVAGCWRFAGFLPDLGIFRLSSQLSDCA